MLKVLIRIKIAENEWIPKYLVLTNFYLISVSELWEHEGFITKSGPLLHFPKKY